MTEPVSTPHAYMNYTYNLKIVPFALQMGKLNPNTMDYFAQNRQLVCGKF